MGLENIYRLSIKKIIVWNIPRLLRAADVIAYFLSFGAVQAKLYERFYALAKRIDYLMNISAMGMDIERALNDRYDPMERTITLMENYQVEGLPFYLASENKQVVFYKQSQIIGVPMFTKSETEMYAADFKILVGQETIFNKDEMEAYINLFCVPSKTFIIQVV